MKYLKCWLLALGFLGCLPGWGEADFMPAVDFSSGNLDFLDTRGRTFGYSFSTENAPLTVNALGLWANAGFVGGTTVRIYVDGTTTNLASVAIPAGAPVSSPTAHGNTYAYEAIPPLTLLPNTTYDIVADLVVLDSFTFGATGIVTAPDIVFGAARGAVGTGRFPTGDPLGGGPYFGPTFEIAAAPSVIPEPSTFAILGTSLAGVLGGAWWRRRTRAA